MKAIACSFCFSYLLFGICLCNSRLSRKGVLTLKLKGFVAGVRVGCRQS